MNDDQLFDPGPGPSTGGDAEMRTQQNRAYPRELYDGRPPAEKVDTSRAAADSVTQVSGKLRQQVLATIKAHPEGLTSDAIEEILDGRHQTISARVRELALLEKIERRGLRPTRSGCSASVWVISG